MDNIETHLAAIEARLDDLKKTVDRTYRIFFLDRSHRRRLGRAAAHRITVRGASADL
ncbi:MAG: hypothetical protein WCT10_01250 [Patescibacteria group bacterium]|jgi:hypothetical protein